MLYVKNSKRELYGRNKGHKLSVRQNELMTSLLPRLRVDIHKTARDCSLFSGIFDEVWMEIGFGGGEHLTWQAAKHEKVGFLGCEPFVNGVAKVVSQIEDDGLENIRLYDDDARLVLEWLPDSVLSKVFILFPDPWPKKRHRKRRFIGEDTLDLISSAMQHGAKLHFATDIGDYAKTALLAFLRHKSFKWLDNRPVDWRQRHEERPVTRYEQKALTAGRKPAYLTFECVKGV